MITNNLIIVPMQDIMDKVYRQLRDYGNNCPITILLTMVVRAWEYCRHYDSDVMDALLLDWPNIPFNNRPDAPVGSNPEKFLKILIEVYKILDPRLEIYYAEHIAGDRCVVRATEHGGDLYVFYEVSTPNRSKFSG